MSPVDAERAKLAGLRKTIGDRLENPNARHFDPAIVLEYFDAYARAASTLKKKHPQLLGDFPPDRTKPQPTNTSDFHDRGYIERHDLKQVVVDIDYMFEVLGYLSHKGSPPGSAEPIDVKDLSPAKVWRAIMRLKFSSLAILLGLFVVGTGAIAGFVRAQYEARLAASAASVAFADAFAIQFADHQALKQVVPAVLVEQPNGITTYEEALASLLWQVKSQAGFAEFLSDEGSTAMQVTFTDDSMEFKWEHGANPLLQILPNAGLDPTKERLTQLNTELNLFGVAWLDGTNYIVRRTDGGLAIVGPEE